MKDYYKNTRDCIDKYNLIADKIYHCVYPTDDSDDEFMLNFSMYLAHSLIQDVGDGQLAREDLAKTADIIKVMCND